MYNYTYPKFVHSVLFFYICYAILNDTDMRARYNRISTANQKLERQLVKQHDGEKLYNDVVSGAKAFEEREQGKQLIQDVKDGIINYISFSSVDRAGRNLNNIISTLNLFDEYGVTVKIDNLGIESRIGDKKNPTFNLIVSVMANVAEMERETMLERQREGIAIAKAKGTYKGRVRGSKEASDVFLSRHKKAQKLLEEGYSLRNTAKICETSLGTIQKVRTLMSTYCKSSKY